MGNPTNGKHSNNEYKENFMERLLTWDVNIEFAKILIKYLYW